MGIDLGAGLSIHLKGLKNKIEELKRNLGDEMLTSNTEKWLNLNLKCSNT